MEHVYEAKCKVLGEVYLPISHNLLVIEPIGANSSLNEEIDEVYSHPQAFAQCAQWMRRHLPRAKLRETTSTSEAASFIKTTGMKC